MRLFTQTEEDGVIVARLVYNGKSGVLVSEFASAFSLHAQQSPDAE